MPLSMLTGPLGHIRFFGTVSASISHEIKNVLSIIRERAGLIEDLIEMGAEAGRPPDPERLRMLAARIQDQTVRADGIVKRMNRLAHSIDREHASVDLVDLVELIIALSERRASQASVALAFAVDSTAPRPAVMIATCPFALLHGIWICLGAAIDSPGAERSIEVDVQLQDDGAAIMLRGVDAAMAIEHEQLRSSDAVRLLELLGLQTVPDRSDPTGLVLQLGSRLPGEAGDDAEGQLQIHDGVTS